jgi:hypothetical protein
MARQVAAKQGAPKQGVGDERAGDYTNSGAVIDACRPWHWRDKFLAVNMPTADARREALQKLGHLLR